MPLDARAFRSAMGSLANGVTVISVVDEHDRPMGMTATAVCSLSLEPPLLLVCVGHEGALHDLITRAPWFGVLVLAADQRDLAERFATRGRQAFDADGPRTPARLPRLPGVVATIDCRRRAVFEGGDHSIVTGELEWADVAGGAPLLHQSGVYARLAP